MAEGASSRRERLKDEAAAWVVRLSKSDVGEDERAAFETWRDASPEHEVAYEREAATWSRLDRLQALRPAATQSDCDLLASEQFAVNDDQPLRSKSWTLPRRAAAAFIGIVGLGTLTAIGFGFGADPAYATAVGERRLVVLEDGSRIELNTNSEIRVHFHHRRREVELVKGEASFDVAEDKRPFLITTSDASFAAGASELTVRLKAGGASLAVREGAVNALEPGSSAKPIRVAAGYGGVFGEDGGQPRQITPDEMARTLAWQEGAIALDGQTLADAVAEFNRYNVQKIVITDPSISGYRLGGYFQTDDIGGFVRALQTTFPIQAAKDPNGSVLLEKRAYS